MAEIRKDRRIVVGVDGSAASRRALAWAVRQARLTGAVVDALHAWQVPVTFDMAPLFVHPDELEKQAEKVLVAAVSEVCGEHPAATVRARVVQGHPAAALVRAARDADALVVGSRGHGGFVGALLGSVSQHCVHHATCPVVVVREPATDPR
jgi:nucleotide-binding universal stress UspA family protein